jgi:hypothetical protein
MADEKPKHRVLVGINYPPDNTRAEPGDIVDNIPEYALSRLVNAGVIEPVTGKKGGTK